MGKRAYVAAGVIALSVGLFLSRRAVARSFVTFRTPHVARAPAATLDAALLHRIDADVAAAPLTTPGELIAFGLDESARSLHFGLGHKTRIAFDATEREGNCVEYAELFASIVNREHGAVSARAWVVRSDARIFGEQSANPAYKDHDWVLVIVQAADGPKRFYVDPTFYDLSLGWDISGAVQGEVRTQ